MKKDWITFMYQDKVFYPFLVLQLVFIWYFFGDLIEGRLGPIETTIGCTLFFLLILFYAASGRRIIKMLDEVLEDMEKK